MRFYASPESFILFVKQKFLGLFCCIIHLPPNIYIALLYTAILLTDVFTASEMRMREKLGHKRES